MFDVGLAKNLHGLLEEKQNLLDRIVAVTALQPPLIQGDDVQLLMNNIEERQNLIDAIDSIDGQVADVADQMGEPDDSQQWSSFRASLKTINAKMRDTLLKIDEQDKSNERLAKQKLEEYQKGIQTLKTGEKSVTAYNAPPTISDGMYFDKKN